MAPARRNHRTATSHDGLGLDQPVARPACRAYRRPGAHGLRLRRGCRRSTSNHLRHPRHARPCWRLLGLVPARVDHDREGQRAAGYRAVRGGAGRGRAVEL